MTEGLKDLSQATDRPIESVVDESTLRRRRRVRNISALVLLAALLALPLFRSMTAYNYVLQVGVSVFMWMAL